MDILQLSSRMASMEDSPTLALNALAKSMQKDGVDVVNLTAGETDFDTDMDVQKKAYESMQKGNTRYSASLGTMELRTRLSTWFQERWNLSYTANEIAVTFGVKQALFNLILSVVSKEDEVIIPVPYWVSYPSMVTLAGGRCVFLPSSAKDSFRISADKMKKLITDRTRMLILNYPNNPSGALQSTEELHSIAKLLEGTGILVVSDEIYGELSYEEKFVSFATLSEDSFRRTITMNGLSKSHAMTGWRIGCAAGDAKIIKAMGIIQAQSASNVPVFIQDAAIQALAKSNESLEERKRIMEEKRNLAFTLLQKDSNIFLEKPKGAFYCFADMSAYYGKESPKKMKITNSASLSKYFLEEALVAVVPGVVFGEDKCIRISFAADIKTLETGISRILSSLKELK